MKLVMLLFIVLILFIGCKENSTYGKEFRIVEECLEKNYLKGQDIHDCFGNISYEIYGYYLDDKKFKRTNFKDSVVNCDSVPRQVLMAFKMEGLSCVTDNSLNIKARNKLWLVRDMDSIFTMVSYYY